MMIYRVGTFIIDPKKRPSRSNVLAYLRDYSPAEEGCIVYEIEAENWTIAKRIAQARRVEYEFRMRSARNTLYEETRDLGLGPLIGGKK